MTKWLNGPPDSDNPQYVPSIPHYHPLIADYHFLTFRPRPFAHDMASPLSRRRVVLSMAVRWSCVYVLRAVCSIDEYNC
jgi:hypothetical protein